MIKTDGGRHPRYLLMHHYSWDCILHSGNLSGGCELPVFAVLSRVDAYVAGIEADTAEEAVDIAYDGGPGVDWSEQGVVEFEARHVVALDDDGEEIGPTARGKG